jgi:hypothetical protein
MPPSSINENAGARVNEVDPFRRAGVHPKIVSTLAGHSTVSFTLSTYTAAWDEGIDDAAAQLGDALQL